MSARSLRSLPGSSSPPPGLELSPSRRPRVPGITLAGLEALCRAAGGRVHLRGTSTRDVAEMMLGGGGGGAACVDLLADDGGEALSAPATVYVVHAWDAPFLDLVDALAAWQAAQPAQASAAPPPQSASWRGRLPGGAAHSFFVDALCAAQPAAAADAASLASEASPRLLGAGAVVLALGRWSAPAPLARAWCLWELSAALASRARVDVAGVVAQLCGGSNRNAHPHGLRLEWPVARVAGVIESANNPLVPGEWWPRRFVAALAGNTERRASRRWLDG